MKPRHASTLCTLLALFTVCAAPALAGKHKKTCCPHCNAPCELKVSEGTETKHCWKTESKTVCIPRVRFSWRWPWDKYAKCDQTCDGSCGQKCCAPPRFGKSREVCVLIKHEYECPVCEYTWEPREVCDPACTSLPDEALATSPASTSGTPPAPNPALPIGNAAPQADSAAKQAPAGLSNPAPQRSEPPSQVWVSPLGASYLRGSNGETPNRAIPQVGSAASQPTH